MENCIFCKIAKGEIPSYKVYEDDDFLVFLDNFRNLIANNKTFGCSKRNLPKGGFHHLSEK